MVLELFVFLGLAFTGLFGGPGLFLFLGVCLGVPSVFVYRRERNSRAVEYDDHLSQQRVKAAFDKFLKEVSR